MFRGVVGPFTGTAMDNEDCWLSRSIRMEVLCNGIGCLSGIVGGFKKLREAGRVRFHLSWHLSDFMLPSYEHNTSTLERLRSNVAKS